MAGLPRNDFAGELGFVLLPGLCDTQPSTLLPLSLSLRLRYLIGVLFSASLSNMAVYEGRVGASGGNLELLIGLLQPGPGGIDLSAQGSQ